MRAGEFACPYCEGEFEWGMDEEDELDAFMLQADTSTVIQTQNVVIPQAENQTQSNCCNRVFWYHDIGCIEWRLGCLCLDCVIFCLRYPDLASFVHVP